MVIYYIVNIEKKHCFDTKRFGQKDFFLNFIELISLLQFQDKEVGK